MINGLEGIPGSGKSYEAVVNHVLHALRGGRKVITNLPLDVEAFAAINPEYRGLIEIRNKPMPVLGTWDADRTPAFLPFAAGEDALGFQSPIYTRDGVTAQVRSKPKLFGGVWDFYSDWKSETGQGPLFIIDECHVGMPRIGTDPQVIEWYKLHRHFNVDVLLCTQNFRDVCGEIASLLAMLIRVRKADILGKKDCYIRKVHAGFRGAVISTEERKYQQQYFPLYKSHTQGNSVAEAMATDVKPLLVNFNRVKWAWLVMCVPVTVWAFWPSSKPAPRPLKAQATQASLTAFRPLPGASAPTAAKTAPDSDPDALPEPFAVKGVHMTGRMSMGGRVIYTFALSNNAVFVTTVTSDELTKMGYAWKAFTDCSGLLTWNGSKRVVTCDSPRATLAAIESPAPQ